MPLSRRAGRLLRGVGAVADRFLCRYSRGKQAVQRCSLTRVLIVIELILVAGGRAVRTILAREEFIDGRCHILPNLAVKRVWPKAPSS